MRDIVNQSGNGGRKQTGDAHHHCWPVGPPTHPTSHWPWRHGPVYWEGHLSYCCRDYTSVLRLGRSVSEWAIISHGFMPCPPFLSFLGRTRSHHNLQQQPPNAMGGLANSSAPRQPPHQNHLRPPYIYSSGELNSLISSYTQVLCACACVVRRISRCFVCAQSCAVAPTMAAYIRVVAKGTLRGKGIAVRYSPWKLVPTAQLLTVGRIQRQTDRHAAH